MFIPYKSIYANKKTSVKESKEGTSTSDKIKKFLTEEMEVSTASIEDAVSKVEDIIVDAIKTDGIESPVVDTLSSAASDLAYQADMSSMTESALNEEEGEDEDKDEDEMMEEIQRLIAEEEDDEEEEEDKDEMNESLALNEEEDQTETDIGEEPANSDPSMEGGLDNMGIGKDSEVEGVDAEHDEAEPFKDEQV